MTYQQSSTLLHNTPSNPGREQSLPGLPTPYYHDEDAGITIYHGDCREILPHLPKVDLVLTDPPYSSGGQFRGDRAAKPSKKYVQTDSIVTCREDFSGDNMDQRAFLKWASLWLTDALLRVKGCSESWRTKSAKRAAV